MYSVAMLGNNLKAENEYEIFESILSDIEEMGITLQTGYNMGEYSIIDANEKIVSAFKELEIDETRYKIKIYEQSYGENFDAANKTIEIVMQSETESIKFYETKIQLKRLLNKYFKEVYILNDTHNEEVCMTLYLLIHKIENKFRNYLNIIMVRNHGINWFNENIDKDYIAKSNNFASWYRTNYDEYKNVQLSLFNLQTDELIEMLKCSYVGEFNKEELDKINSFKNSLGEKSKLIIKNDCLCCESIWTAEIKNMLPDDFEEQWSVFVKMRNMIAHNKPICNPLQTDIKKMANTLDEMLEKFKKRIDIRVNSIEELLAVQIQADIEEGFMCEEAGIKKLQDEETVIDEIVENEIISDLMFLLDEFAREYITSVENLEGLVDEVIQDGFSTEIKNVDVIKAYAYLNCLGEKNDSAKLELLKKMDNEIAEDFILDDVIEQLSNIDFDIDLKKSDVFKLDGEIFSCKSILGKEYILHIDGIISPEKGATDEIQLKMTVNHKIIQSGYIIKNYADYEYNEEQCYAMPTALDELEVHIDDLLEELKKQFDMTISTLKEIYNFIEMLM